MASCYCEQIPAARSRIAARTKVQWLARRARYADWSVHGSRRRIDARRINVLFNNAAPVRRRSLTLVYGSASPLTLPRAPASNARSETSATPCPISGRRDRPQARVASREMCYLAIAWFPAAGLQVGDDATLYSSLASTSCSGGRRSGWRQDDVALSRAYLGSRRIQ